MHVPWCKRGEAVEKRGGGGGLLRADRSVGSKNWWSALHPGRPRDYIKGHIGGLYYMNFVTGADLNNFC